MRYRTAMLLLTVVALAGCNRQRGGSAPASSQDQNSVAAFLANAERQSETDEQRREIQRALRDMVNKSPTELRQMRYADYQGRPGAWSVTQLLQRYYAPDPPMTLDENRFYQDVAAPAARAVILRQLDAVTQALPREPGPSN